MPTRAKQARLILPSAAEAKPKIKELNRMYGLDTYDYGARQYDPVHCRWDRIDPLCEKYYSVSPYVYCMNNPVMNVDPDGEKSHNYMAIIYKGVKDNDLVSERNHCAFCETSSGIEITADNIDKFTNVLNRDDKGWDKKETPIIVLHSCKSANVAQDMSGTEELQGVYIIAPTTSVRSTKNGEELNYQCNKATPNKKTRGLWKVFFNGKPVLDNNDNAITYPWNAQPGTIGFDYRFPDKSK